MNPSGTDDNQQAGPPAKKRIVGEAHGDAVQLLADNRFQAETLEGPEVYAAAGLQPGADQAAPVEPTTFVAS